MTHNANRLRILHVIPSLGIGGAEVMAMHLMTGLAPTHDVRAIGLYPRRASLVERRLAEAGVLVSHLGKKRGFDLAMYPELNREVREFRPDVVHTHLSVLRYILPILVRRRVPLAVHTLHNAAEREADGIGKFVQRIAFRRTVFPVAISMDGAATYERVYGRSCAAVIPNCIPVEEFQAASGTGTRWRKSIGIAADSIVFTCVGRLEEQKNPLGLLAAFAMVTNPKARLVLLGDGSFETKIADFIAAKGIQNVHMLGARNDVVDCLAGSDVFTLASDWEGSPLAVMEAMASGVPVISTAVGGVPELVDHGGDGLLVSPRDSAGLAAAMQDLADHAERRRALGAAARSRALADFGVERMTRHYEVLYRSLLNRASGVNSRTWLPGKALGASAAENEGR